MIKKLALNNDIKTKLDTICKAMGIDLSETESDLIRLILAYSDNLQLTLTSNTRKSITDHLNFTDTNLSTSIYRLEKKGLIARQNKTIILNPDIFSKLDELTGLFVEFK